MFFSVSSRPGIDYFSALLYNGRRGDLATSPDNMEVSVYKVFLPILGALVLAGAAGAAPSAPAAHTWSLPGNMTAVQLAQAAKATVIAPKAMLAGRRSINQIPKVNKWRCSSPPAISSGSSTSTFAIDLAPDYSIVANPGNTGVTADDLLMSAWMWGGSDTWTNYPLSQSGGTYRMTFGNSTAERPSTLQSVQICVGMYVPNVQELSGSKFYNSFWVTTTPSFDPGLPDLNKADPAHLYVLRAMHATYTLNSTS